MWCELGTGHLKSQNKQNVGDLHGKLSLFSGFSRILAWWNLSTTMYVSCVFGAGASTYVISGDLWCWRFSALLKPCCTDRHHWSSLIAHQPSPVTLDWESQIPQKVVFYQLLSSSSFRQDRSWGWLTCTEYKVTHLFFCGCMLAFMAQLSRKKYTLLRQGEGAIWCFRLLLTLCIMCLVVACISITCHMMLTNGRSKCDNSGCAGTTIGVMRHVTGWWPLHCDICTQERCFSVVRITSDVVQIWSGGHFELEIYIELYLYLIIYSWLSWLLSLLWTWAVLWSHPAAAFCMFAVTAWWFSIWSEHLMSPMYCVRCGRWQPQYIWLFMYFAARYPPTPHMCLTHEIVHSRGNQVCRCTKHGCHCVWGIGEIPFNDCEPMQSSRPVMITSAVVGARNTFLLHMVITPVWSLTNKLNQSSQSSNWKTKRSVVCEYASSALCTLRNIVIFTTQPVGVECRMSCQILP